MTQITLTPLPPPSLESPTPSEAPAVVGPLPPIATLLFLASLSIRRSVHVLLLLPRLPPQPSDLACYYLGSRVPLCGEICLVFACSVFLSLSLQ